MDEIKLVMLAELSFKAEAFINQAVTLETVPRFEQQTWAIQAVEAKEWAADKSAQTPMLDSIAAARGIAPDKLKDAALRKTLAYERLTANIVGQRQALQSKIERATDMAALEAIEIVFTEPEAV